MAEFKTIPIGKIFVPERLRAVEEDHALAIQASIVEHGLINPITVRHVPNQAKGKQPYVLITGAHRLRAVELNDETEIEALIVKADADEAQLLEITENLFRNELSALDRATFVMSYREIWERKFGKIGPGNRVNITQLIAEEAQAGFSKHVAERLGCSTETIKLAQRIGKALTPELRRSLRGTAVADNQSVLLKLARMDADRQRRVAKAYGQDADIARAIETTDPDARPKAVRSQQQELLDRLIAAWERADEATRTKFLDHANATPRKKRDRLPSVSEIVTGGADAA